MISNLYVSELGHKSNKLIFERFHLDGEKVLYNISWWNPFKNDKQFKFIQGLYLICTIFLTSCHTHLCLSDLKLGLAHCTWHGTVNHSGIAASAECCYHCIKQYSFICDTVALLACNGHWFTGRSLRHQYCFLWSPFVCTSAATALI